MVLPRLAALFAQPSAQRKPLAIRTLGNGEVAVLGGVGARVVQPGGRTAELRDDLVGANGGGFGGDADLRQQMLLWRPQLLVADALYGQPRGPAVTAVRPVPSCSLLAPVSDMSADPVPGPLPRQGPRRVPPHVDLVEYLQVRKLRLRPDGGRVNAGH